MEYFAAGTRTTTYVENKEVDFTSREIQEQMIEFNENLEACTDCVEDWNMESSLKSWYTTFNAWVKAGACGTHSDDNDVFTVDPA